MVSLCTNTSVMAGGKISITLMRFAQADEKGNMPFSLLLLNGLALGRNLYNLLSKTVARGKFSVR